MKSQQLCLMPAACTRCEKLFDVSDDFREEEEIAERDLLGANRETICWECRFVDLSDKKKRKRR